MKDLRDGAYFVDKLRELGRLVRAAVMAARAANADLSRVTKFTSADTIYQLDAHVEPVIEEYCAAWAKEMPLVLVAEGIGEEGQGGGEGKAVFPKGMPEAAAAVRIIMDPIDGTRGLMYDKRAAWFLAGVAENKGEGGGGTRLSDIFAAVQVEVPTSKQAMSDVLWAIKGRGAKGMREELQRAEVVRSTELALRASQAETLSHGFAAISNFFPGTKTLASALMEIIAEACTGPADGGGASVFDDQYISTGGQFYELIVGHDRMNADLRPVFYEIQARARGQKERKGLCVHPYDVATALIAREAGVEITDGLGNELDGPLDVTTPLAWAGFANKALRARVEPVMIATLTRWLAEGV